MDRVTPARACVLIEDPIPQERQTGSPATTPRVGRRGARLSTLPWVRFPQTSSRKTSTSVKWTGTRQVESLAPMTSANSVAGRTTADLHKPSYLNTLR